MRVFSLFLIFSALFLASLANANDGGIASIKVNDIRMREYELKNGQDQEIRRISKPNFKISFSGGEAAKLQKILPSTLSVLTAMQPEIKDVFNESFKTLGIYSKDTNKVTGKVITINCVDADLKPISGNDGKFQIVKRAESNCEIIIKDSESGMDNLGDASPFSPPVCR